MRSDGSNAARRHRLLLFLLLASAVFIRLYRINAPLLDGMAVKQVAVANKARNIAGPPLAPLCDTFDFLDHEGRPAVLTEEVPVYTSILGTAYRLFGEHEWLGRLLGVLATVVALAAFHDWIRREFDDELALLATFVLNFCPLLLFYGRAVLPDPYMLASMLLAACWYRRYLDEGKRHWLLLAGLAAALAPLFKNYGLMVLLPLADMTWRQRGWRAWLRRDFLALVAVSAGPVLLWTGLVFAARPNPTSANRYFIFQQVDGFRWWVLFKRYLDRFWWKDCGPVCTVLIGVGGLAMLKGWRAARPIVGWTAMALAFFVLLAPKLTCHDYYELMMLPAAAVWAALGWRALANRAAVLPVAPRLRIAVGAAMLVGLAVIQSPWLSRSKYDLDIGCRVVAERLNQVCPPGGRVIVCGSDNVLAILHYARRPGWVALDLPRADWQPVLDHYRVRGAEYLALYRNLEQPTNQPGPYDPAIRGLPVVEHGCGPWSTGGRPAEYFILHLTRQVLATANPPDDSCVPRLALFP